jgi:hypothetical protein
MNTEVHINTTPGGADPEPTKEVTTTKETTQEVPAGPGVAEVKTVERETHNEPAQ